MKPLVVNLFGAPCSGKSTMAAGLFYRLKREGNNVELAYEYAKEMTYQGRWDTLKDQIYIFAKQRARIDQLVPHCEMIITDCPVLLGANYYPELFPDSFRDLLLWAFNQHDTLNLFLTREHAYSPHGRRQTEEEADQVSKEMRNFLDGNGVSYQTIPGSDDGLEEALMIIEKRLHPEFYAPENSFPCNDIDVCMGCGRVHATCTCYESGC